MSDKSPTENQGELSNEGLLNLTPEEISDKLALSWLEKHGNVFCGFVNGRWLQKEKYLNSEINQVQVCDVYNGKHLYNIFVPVDNKALFSQAAKNSSEGFKIWSCMSPKSRSKILLNIAETLEKYRELFASVEAVSSGKHLSRVKDNDIPNLIESFNYYACAHLENDWIPSGPICVVPEEYNNPSLILSLRVSSILASGSSVLLLPDIKCCLSSFLLAEICFESGLPGGVLNVIPINQAKFDSLGTSPVFSKLIFTGNKEKSTLFSKLSAEAETLCDILIPKRPVAIVYERADLHSAADSILEAFANQDTRSTSGGCKVMIQESVCKKFLQILTDRMPNVLVGHNMSATDMSCIVSEEQKGALNECLKEAEKLSENATIELKEDEDRKYTYMTPTLITNVPCGFRLAYEELGGPVIVTVPFRTVKESLAMFNSDNKGSPVSIWTEQISVAMEVALKLKTSAVCVNSSNVNDAKIPFSSIHFSGNSIAGGKEALLHHMSVTDSEKETSEVKQTYDDWLSSPNRFEKDDFSIIGTNSTVKEYKLFIGGSMKQSKKGIIQENIFIPSATESDVDSAVSSAVAEQPKWESLTNLKRRKVLFDVIDKLKKSKKEFIHELHNVTKKSADKCEVEVDLALDILFILATQHDKCCGPMHEISENFMVIQDKYPLGVIGVQCPDEKPLLSLILLVFSTIIHGNAVVAISSMLYPTIAFKMCEIFSSAKIPGGIINIICGNNKCLVPALCKNTDVNAIWFTDVPPKIIYDNSSLCQRVFHCDKMWVGFNKAKNLKCVNECTFTKAIILPFGDIYAN